MAKKKIRKIIWKENPNCKNGLLGYGTNNPRIIDFIIDPEGDGFCLRDFTPRHSVTFKHAKNMQAAKAMATKRLKEFIYIMEQIVDSYKA